ncbi:TPA: hypothetical protein DEP21_05710 [Patescibacteria group bacterium]|nr:hypothetical protein [Candidatus Gracilibacteria bacterium]
MKAVTSRQAYNNLTNTVNNPFETLEDMFQQIPLLDLHSRDVNIKVPMISSENILSYISYMK